MQYCVYADSSKCVRHLENVLKFNPPQNEKYGFFPLTRSAIIHLDCLSVSCRVLKILRCTLQFRRRPPCCWVFQMHYFVALTSSSNIFERWRASPELGNSHQEQSWLICITLGERENIKILTPPNGLQKCVSGKKRLTNKPRKKKKVLQMKTRSSGCSPTAPCQMIYFTGTLPKQSGLQWFHLQI